MPSIASVDVYVRGQGGVPLGRATIPHHVLSDYGDLYSEALELRPDTTIEELVRAVWRAGCKSVERQLLAKAPIHRDRPA